MNNALLVFIKNPQLGKAKTRLAKTVGDLRALEIYQLLLDYTRKVSLEVNADKSLYYSKFIEEDDWPTKVFEKKVQEGSDLGERMANAIKATLEAGAEKVVLIGSDCAELTTAIIEEAFRKLDDAPIVFGPALDGGYYLIGMTKFFPFIFQNKAWSTDTLLQVTLEEIVTNNSKYCLLPKLSDVDTEEDWNRVKARLNAK